MARSEKDFPPGGADGACGGNERVRKRPGGMVKGESLPCNMLLQTLAAQVIWERNRLPEH